MLLKRWAKSTPELMQAARNLELELKKAEAKMQGDPIRSSRFIQTEPSIMGRIGRIMWGAGSSSYGLTKTHREQYDIAKQSYAELEGEISELIGTKLPALRKQLDDAGAPWTAGRAIPSFSSSN